MMVNFSTCWTVNALFGDDTGLISFPPVRTRAAREVSVREGRRHVMPRDGCGLRAVAWAPCPWCVYARTRRRREAVARANRLRVPLARAIAGSRLRRSARV